MNRPRRRSSRQRIAQLSDNLIVLSSSDSESELSNTTDLTIDVDDVVDLTAVNDLSVIVLDSPVHSARRRICQRRRRVSNNSRPRQTSRSASPFSGGNSENSQSYHQSLVDLRISGQPLNTGDSCPEEKLTQSGLEESSSSWSNHGDGSSIDDQLCPLCLDTYKEIKAKGHTLVSTTCGHVFCKKCVKQCINSNCPTCRKKLTAKSIHPLYL